MRKGKIGVVLGDGKEKKGKGESLHSDLNLLRGREKKKKERRDTKRKKKASSILTLFTEGKKKKEEGREGNEPRLRLLLW